MQPQNVNKLKVNYFHLIIYQKNFLYFIIQGALNPRYKTTLCKKFSNGQGCPYGDKCQFAHGAQELRMNNVQGIPQNMLNSNKPQNSLLNYKIVKCKNWDKDGTCKYGAHCTFAHGDEELRNKADNLYQFNPSMQFMMPMMIPSPGMDMNQMQQLMANGQLMMGMGMGMNMNNMAPNIAQEQENQANNAQNEEKP